MDIIIEEIIRFLIRAFHWRTLLCLSLGTVLAAIAHAHIAADPLRWTMAGTIVFASLMLGLKWEDYRTEIR